MSQKNRLKSALVASLAPLCQLSADDVMRLIEKPKNMDFGDWAFPCFSVAKALKQNPAAIASKIQTEITLPPEYSEVKATGPFLNFSFQKLPFTISVVCAVLQATHIGNQAERTKSTVLVEYSSPNIAKPFHVGHLRTTLLGHSLFRIYQYLGYKTISINHLGDWGTQFGFVYAGCKLWGKPENPSVNSLVDLYKRATALKEQQEAQTVAPEEQALPEVNAIARQFFLDLEAGIDYALEFWKWCSDVSVKYLKEAYSRLGIRFDHYTGESFYSDKLQEVNDTLKAKGLLQESQGALGVDLGEKLGFARIATPDGRSLYLTRDIATVFYRTREFKFDRTLYVVGAPQTLHFQQLQEILRKLDHPAAEKIIHVAYGHVLGMKTRGGGEVVELNQFLDEAERVAKEAYHSQVTKRPEGLDENQVAKAVGTAAIVFADLSRNKIKDVHFSWEHAFEFQGDTGPYLLYAFARLNGIQQKANAAGYQVQAEMDLSALNDKASFALASHLDDFETVLLSVTEENEPCHLALYALELAKLVSQAYSELKVIGTDKAIGNARLTLFEAVRRVLKDSIELLGMIPIERM